MPKLVRCVCGYVARGETEDEVVGLIEAHLRSDHPDLVATVSRDDILSWIEEA